MPKLWRIESLAVVLVMLILSIMAIPLYKSYALRANTTRICNSLNGLSLPNWPPITVLPGHKYNIPKQIHIIWLGGVMPQKYLANITKLTALCSNLSPAYTVNLW